MVDKRQEDTRIDKGLSPYSDLRVLYHDPYTFVHEEMTAYDKDRNKYRENRRRFYRLRSWVESQMAYSKANSYFENSYVKEQPLEDLSSGGSNKKGYWKNLSFWLYKRYKIWREGFSVLNQNQRKAQLKQAFLEGALARERRDLFLLLEQKFNDTSLLTNLVFSDRFGLIKNKVSEVLQKRESVSQINNFGGNRTVLDHIFQLHYYHLNLSYFDLPLINNFYWALLLFHPKKVIDLSMFRKGKVINYHLYADKEVVGGLYLSNIIKKAGMLNEVNSTKHSLQELVYNRIFYDYCSQHLRQRIIANEKYARGRKRWDFSTWLGTLKQYGLESESLWFKYNIFSIFYAKNINSLNTPSLSKIFYAGIFGNDYWQRIWRRHLYRSPYTQLKLWLSNTRSFNLSGAKVFGLVFLLSYLFSKVSEYIWFDYLAGFVVFQGISYAASWWWFVYYIIVLWFIIIFIMEYVIVISTLIFRTSKTSKTQSDLREEDILEMKFEEEEGEDWEETMNFALPFFLDYPYRLHFLLTPYGQFSLLYYHRRWYSPQEISQLEWETTSYLRLLQDAQVKAFHNEKVSFLENVVLQDYKFESVSMLNTIQKAIFENYEINQEQAFVWSRNRILYKWFLSLLTLVKNREIALRFLANKFLDILYLDFIFYKRALIIKKKNEMVGLEVKGMSNFLFEKPAKGYLNSESRQLIEKISFLKSDFTKDSKIRGSQRKGIDSGKGVFN